MSSPRSWTVLKKIVTVAICLAAAALVLSSYAETVLKKIFKTSNLAASAPSSTADNVCSVVSQPEPEETYFVGCGGFF